MKPFLDEDFLLQSDAARQLYHNHAARMPILDYHCHINPQEIAEDKRYESITEVWLGGDHYKWRVMRACGIPENEITGALQTDPYLVFSRWAQSLSRAIGNPLYHWSHLELKRYFRIDEPLTAGNARQIYDRCCQRLQEPDMSVRGIIRQSNVRLICTTDDPADGLRWHKALAADRDFDVKVLSAFRPDKAMNIDDPSFAEYICRLSEASGVPIVCFADLKQALESRMDYFADLGGRISDHALETPVFAAADEGAIERIFRKAMAGEMVDGLEADQYRTALLLFLAEAYCKRNWTMQIHFGCIRNNSTRSFSQLGPDTGFDCVGNSRGARALVDLLDAMDRRGCLPKMILYSLNPYDNEIILSAAGSFQRDSGPAGRIQLGSAWWFNDHKCGIEKQLTAFANIGVLGNFIGMLTDSRSFLSYTRHEYFRRILCNLIGGWVENGELPDDMTLLGGLVRDISYGNAVRFLGFEEMLA